MGWWSDSKPVFAMIVMQFSYSGVALFTRAALLQGMSPRVFVVYRQAIATLVVAPIAYFSKGKTERVSLDMRSFGFIFVASLVGLEKVKIRSLRSMAKVGGTILCVGGAISMALLKGPRLLNMELPSSNSFFHSYWILGCLLLFGSCCCWSFWLILQVPMSASYPDHLGLSAWMCFFATFQSGILALCLEPKIATWTLDSKYQLFCCLFAGVVGSAISFFVQGWCISQRGPLFCAMFNPLSTVIVTILACMFLHEELYTGSFIGALAVVGGLYVVLWGKAKEHQQLTREITCNNIDLDKPLLT
ncbi:hypothetical protein ACHQM5_030661 [Ranunculus cassubicifolius]